MIVECNGPEYDSENYVVVACLSCAYAQHEPKKRGDKIAWGCRRCGRCHETNIVTGVTERHALASMEVLEDYYHKGMGHHGATPWGPGFRT